MGQTSSTAEELDAKETVKYQEFVKNYQFLRKIKDPRYGEISILQDKYTKELVALREMLSKSAKDFEKDIISLRARYKISHPNLVKVLGYTSKSEDNFCASIHKILMIVEYLDNDLEKEITLKKNQNNYYKEDQLWYLIENVVKALSVLQKNDIAHEDIKPSSIFISKMGVYKIAQHNVAGNAMPAYHQRMTGLNEGRTYLSPALLTNLQNSELRPQHNPWKSDVFSLGMSILHAATLTNCEKLYNWNNFTLDLEELGERLASLRPRYSEKFQDFVQSMLELRENTRPDFMALETKLTRVSESTERLNPTPGANSLNPRVNEYQQDIPDDMGDDFQHNRFANQQKQKMSRPLPDQENGPYLQRNVTNPIFKEGRIAPLKSEENPIPYSSVESVGQSKRSLPEPRPLESRGPQFWENNRTNEPPLYNLKAKETYGYNNPKENISNDFYNPTYNPPTHQLGPRESNERSFETRDYLQNVDKTYSLPARNEPSEFLVNRQAQKVDIPQTVQYQVPKPEQGTRITSLNDIQNQAPGNTSKLFEPNEDLRKSLISDEVARIMSEFRNKMGIQSGLNNSIDASTPYDNYAREQKENIRTEDQFGLSKDLYNPSKFKESGYPSDNLPLTSNPATTAVFHASTDYGTFSQQPLKMSNREEKLFQQNTSYDNSKDYAYGNLFNKTENKPLSDIALNLPNKPSYEPLHSVDNKTNVIDLSYSATVQQPNIVQNSFEAQKQNYEQTQHHSREEVKRSALPQSWDQPHISQSALHDYGQTSYQATKHETASQPWDQAYVPQANLQVEHNQMSNYYSNSGQNQDHHAQEIQSQTRPLPTQTQTTYESVAQHSYRNEINSFEPYVRNDYQAQQSHQVGYGEQERLYNQQNANPYDQNYASNQSQTQNRDIYSQNKMDAQAVQERHQEAYYDYEPRQQEAVLNAYSSVGSTQNRLSPQANEEEFVNETYPDGSVYEGQKFNGLRHGKGTFYYADGGVYSGEWIEGSMDGYGELYYAGGVKAYEGEWKEDKFHGRGAVYNEMPAQLVGEFDFTNFDVVGDFWVSYEGDFYNDNKEGNGVLLLSNGERFEGEFKEDMVEGIGTFFNVDGRVIRGEWWQNKLMKTL